MRGIDKMPEGETRQTLAHVDLFSCLDEAERQALERRCNWHRWRAGEQIIDRETLSNDVYFVVHGRARVIDYSDTGRREIVFDEIGPGGYFGELAAIDGEPRSANIVAMEDTLTASLTAGAFVELLFEHREIGLSLMRRLTEIIRNSVVRIMDLSTVGAHNRVYSELLRLAKTGGGRPRNTAIIQPIPVHSDIAARVSTTRETVARVMSDLQHRRIVERERDALIIRDVELLTQLAHRAKE
jgi:CRP/FNR family transcriptional regulator, cyclic AMP receptor protein